MVDFDRLLLIPLYDMEMNSKLGFEGDEISQAHVKECSIKFKCDLLISNSNALQLISMILDYGQ